MLAVGGPPTAVAPRESVSVNGFYYGSVEWLHISSKQCRPWHLSAVDAGYRRGAPARLFGRSLAHGVI